MTDNQYGYCIVQTAGLIEDGSAPLSCLRLGLPGPSMHVATWATADAAEAAMRDLVRREAGEDRNPSVWGGYSVRSAFEAATIEAINGRLAPQS